MVVMQHKRETSGGAAGLVVAVAVKGVIGDPTGGGGSRRAVRWTAENLLPKAERCILVHVIPTITSIPTPTGARIPVAELDKHVVEMYVRDIKLEFEKIFVPFKKICKNKSKVETLLLDHDDPAKALIRFVSQSGIKSLVMGSFTSNVITRKLRGPGVPATVLKYAPETCEIYVVCKDRIVTKSVDQLLTGETISSPWMSTRESCKGGSVGLNVFRSLLPIASGEFAETSTRRSSSAKEPEIEPFRATHSQSKLHSSSGLSVRPFGASRLSQHSYLVPQSPSENSTRRSLSAKEFETEPFSATYSQSELHSSSSLSMVRPFGASRLSQHSYLVPQSPTETSAHRSLSAKEPEPETFNATYNQPELHSSSGLPMARPFGASRLSQHSYLVPQSPTETTTNRSLSAKEPEPETFSATYDQPEPHSSSSLPMFRPFRASRLSQHSYLVPQSPTETTTNRSLSAKEPEPVTFSATYDQPELNSSSGLPMVRPFGASRLSQHSYLVPQSPTRIHSNVSVGGDESKNGNLQGNPKTNAMKPIKPIKTGAKIQKENVKTEVEQLKKELQNTVAKYKQACEELVSTQNKVQMLSSECLEEARRVNAALEKEEMMRKTATQEKEKHLHAMKEVEEAKALLAKEFCERQIAEMNAFRQYLKKTKIIDQFISSEWRYRRYTKDEIEKATNLFSPNNVIGEGGYGKVYKCSLYHTPVAVKVLRLDSLEKKEEFLKEVEVLSQLRHPHLVLLLGACPEGCLVYEYLENGSLEEYIYHRNNKPPLPWFIRFRIIFEVACGLAFLHNSKPEPIIHRDLKPGNILLDRNYVSKIGDVGLAKLVSDIVPDNVTAYRHSVLAGTLYYMDPEYQRTSTIEPKSDLYAFGIIILQLLTARHPNGILTNVEDAVKNGTFTEMLDKSVTDWPLAEAEELARISLKCSEIQCRDRPDLEKEVIPVLKRLVEAANAKIKIERSNLRPPSHYFCPILREIMEDPQIAADGFTYERRAIIAWLEKHNVSPVTKQKLKHFKLTPNHTLRSAIQDWRSRVRFSSVLIHKDV